MLALIVLGILIFVGRHLLLNGVEVQHTLGQVLNHSLDGIEFTSAQSPRLPPRLRAELMQLAFDKPWEEWHPEDDHESDFVAPTSSGTLERRYYGPMDMDIAGDRVLIYDMEICSPLGLDNPQLFETVITIKPPSLDLPQFTLRPKNLLGLLLTGNNRFKTETALDTLFEVETMTPHRIKALFQSELGANVLIPFLNEQKWTIEWTGDRLIVYKLNQLIVPDRIADVALEVSEFFDLLKSGPEAVDTVMQELFQTTSTTTTQS